MENGYFYILDKLYVDKFGMSFIENSEVKGKINVDKHKLTLSTKFLADIQKSI